MAQTKQYWKKGSTDLNQNASWTDGVGGSGAVPVASNIVFFLEGSDTITTNPTTLDLALAYCLVGRQFTGNGGSNGTSLTIGANTNGSGETATETFEYAAGGGQWYLAISSGGIDVIKSNSLGKLWITSGTPNTRVECVQGQLDIGGSAGLSAKTLEVWGGEVKVNYKADGTDPTINIYGGTTYLYRPGGTITVNGGNVVLMVESEANCAATLTVNNGFVDHRAGNVATALNLNGGGYTFKNAVRPIDLSGATITAADTEFDALSAPGGKVTWPATSSITLKSGKAAKAFSRVATASV